MRKHCCWLHAEEDVTYKAYPRPEDDDGDTTKYGLIRCTPTRPNGCCSTHESTFDTRTEADKAAEALNKNPSKRDITKDLPCLP